MEITVINVGYGDALLVEWAGRRMLVDGGSAHPEEFADSPFRIPAADYLAGRGIERLDLVVITHIHEDHVCGLEQVLERVGVGEIWSPYDPADFRVKEELRLREEAPASAHLFTEALNAFARICLKAKARGIPMRRLRRGEEIVLGDRALMRVLLPREAELEEFVALARRVLAGQGPASETEEGLVTLDRLSNGVSLVVVLERDGGSALLTADCISDHWGEIDPILLKNVNVLKLPHHGQLDSISEAAARLLRPGAVITTASSDRRYGSANAAIYERLSRDGEPVFLFSDAGDYPPYCSREEGYCAVKVPVMPGVPTPVFIDKQQLEMMEE